MRKSLLLCCVLSPALLSLGWSEPPRHAEWVLTFSDEFNGSGLDWSVWESEHGSRGPQKLEGRWPENNILQGGLLRQVVKREDPPRDGKSWSTAHIWTKQFAQQYGYFECRMRYGKYLNNAFWLYRPRCARFPEKPHFEIDINEGHTPTDVATCLHYMRYPDDSFAGELQSSGKHWDAERPLDQDFHLYGVEWNEQLIIWYFDGRPFRAMVNPNAFAPADLRLSTVLMPGQLKRDNFPLEQMAGVAMEVDYVRAYRKTKDLFPPQLPEVERTLTPEVVRTVPQVPAPAELTVLWQEDFSNATEGGLPPGWQIGDRQPAVVPDEPAVRKPALAPNNRLLRLNAGDYTFRLFERPVSGVLEVEFDCCMQAVTEGLLLVTLGQTDLTDPERRRDSYYTGDIGPYIHWQRGYLSYYTEEKKWTMFGRYPLAQWHHVRLRLDVGRGVFDCYLGPGGGEFAGGGVFRNRQAAACGLGFRHRGQGNGVFVDNVILRASGQ